MKMKKCFEKYLRLKILRRRSLLEAVHIAIFKKAKLVISNHCNKISSCSWPQGATSASKILSNRCGYVENAEIKSFKIFIKKFSCSSFLASWGSWIDFWLCRVGRSVRSCESVDGKTSSSSSEAAAVSS